MNPEAKIYIAGHRGLAGSALVRRLRGVGFHNLLLRNHAELDLSNQAATQAFFAAERPDYVFLAAAKVGGILANNTCPADFIRENLVIQNNVIHAAWEAGVQELMFLGSSCIYPRDCPQPIREDDLLTGPLEATNRPYAIAKIAGIEMCWAYNRQHGTRYLAVMPTNLYGPGDTYDLGSSHVLPALIRKMHEAKQAGLSEVSVWGTGTPRREFLYSEDFADACVHLMGIQGTGVASLFPQGAPPLINIGCGVDMTIRELAERVAAVIGFGGYLRFDPALPDGTPRKLLDIGRLKSLGWQPKTPLTEGIRKVYLDYLGTGEP
ncbi:MAG: GDP-L-fucose synthase [Acidobacteria bacterium]|nr:GDP-L-fucose synthase [Acidobacteriota bacterium]